MINHIFRLVFCCSVYPNRPYARGCKKRVQGQGRKGADREWSVPFKLTWDPLFFGEERKRVEGHALITKPPSHSRNELLLFDYPVASVD